VQRTFATARSVEFDALLLAGAPAPGKDAYGARDAKAGNGTPGGLIDSRVLLMLSEAFRHAKPLGGWANAEQAFTAAGIDTAAPGVLVADSGEAVLQEVVRLLGQHRIWERFPTAADI
jgi:catalase